MGEAEELNKFEVHAPKNQHNKGDRICFLQKIDIQGSLCPDGKNADVIFLDMNRMRDKIRMMNGINDEEILSLFDTAEGFRRIVSGIGFSFDHTDAQQIDLEGIFYGKEDRYVSGTHCHISCPTDGRETLLWMDEVQWGTDDDILGQLRFCFPGEGMCAKATVVFYVQEGYHLPQLELEPPVNFESEQYDKMIDRSLLSTGNNFRLKMMLDKVQEGKPINLAFIGGSITQGAGAKPGNTECYSYHVWKDLGQMLGTQQISYTRAGLGGTPSELGLLRFEKDVLRKEQPDIVVIEFAVNDADDETEGRCFEGLIRKIMMRENHPAVILLFSVFSNDWNLQDRLAPIGRYYGLPMVSILDAVSPQFGKSKDDGGVISKRQYFYDCFHPTNDGHRIMADCLLNLMEYALDASQDENISMPIRTMTGRTFETARLIDRISEDIADGNIDTECGDFSATDTELQMAAYDDEMRDQPQFPNNWMHTAQAGSSPFVIRLRCRSLFLITKDAGEDNFGAATVIVDGKMNRTIDPHQVGWTHCHPFLLFESDRVMQHEIRIQMAPENEHKAFTILGFGVC